MNNVLGYQDKNVVVTGAASGMGQAAAQLLLDLGANVYAIDIAEVDLAVAATLQVDMKDQASIDATCEAGNNGAVKTANTKTYTADKNVYLEITKVE